MSLERYIPALDAVRIAARMAVRLAVLIVSKAASRVAAVLPVASLVAVQDGLLAGLLELPQGHAAYWQAAAPLPAWRLVQVWVRQAWAPVGKPPSCHSGSNPPTPST